MAIKWGSTKVTAVKWGSTNCTCVKWGNTVVFPDEYNGSSFTYPIASGFSNGLSFSASGNYNSSGSPHYLYETRTSDTIDFSQYTSVIFSIKGYMSDPGGGYADDIWSYLGIFIQKNFPSSYKSRTVTCPKDNSTITYTYNVSSITGSDIKIYITYCVESLYRLSVSHNFSITGISFI